LGRTGEPLPHSKPGKGRPNINANNYLSARSTGKAMLKHAYAAAFVRQSRGRAVVAHSLPDIQSAGDTKQKATSIYAALRALEHTQNSAPP